MSRFTYVPMSKLSLLLSKGLEMRFTLEFDGYFDYTSRMPYFFTVYEKKINGLSILKMPFTVGITVINENGTSILPK